MHGRADGEPDTEHELTFKPTEQRVEKSAKTLTLDGNPYADGDAEPVEKGYVEGYKRGKREESGADADERTTEPRGVW